MGIAQMHASTYCCVVFMCVVWCSFTAHVREMLSPSSSRRREEEEGQNISFTSSASVSLDDVKEEWHHQEDWNLVTPHRHSTFTFLQEELVEEEERHKEDEEEEEEEEKQEDRPNVHNQLEVQEQLFEQGNSLEPGLLLDAFAVPAAAQSSVGRREDSMQPGAGEPRSNESHGNHTKHIDLPMSPSHISSRRYSSGMPLLLSPTAVMSPHHMRRATARASCQFSKGVNEAEAAVAFEHGTQSFHAYLTKKYSLSAWDLSIFEHTFTDTRQPQFVEYLVALANMQYSCIEPLGSDFSSPSHKHQHVRTFKCLHHATKKLCCAKIFELDEAMMEGKNEFLHTLQATVKEIIECRLEDKHTGSADSMSHCVQYYDIHVILNTCWIVSEFCDLQSWKHIMQEKPSKQQDVTERLVATILHEVLLAVQELHQGPCILHQSIKASNVLLSSPQHIQQQEEEQQQQQQQRTGGSIKLSDFACNKEIQHTFTKRAQLMVFYQPPESIVSSAPLTTAADVWQIGLLCYELLSGHSPYQQYIKQPLKVLQKIVKESVPALEPCDHYSADVQQFLDVCFQKEPSQRATIQQLLNHPFITKNKGSIDEVLEFVRE